MARGYFRTSSYQCVCCGKSPTVASEGKGANLVYLCTDCLLKSLSYCIKNNESLQNYKIWKLDLSGLSGLSDKDIIDLLKDMKRLGYKFNEKFHLFYNGEDITDNYTY